MVESDLMQGRQSGDDVGQWPDLCGSDHETRSRRHQRGGGGSGGVVRWSPLLSNGKAV